MVKIKSGIWKVIMLTMVALIIAIFVSGRFGSGVTYADTSNLSMAATIQPSMTITVSDASKTLDITPSSDGAFGSTSITVGAYSNGSVGYTLTMTPSNTSLTSLLGTIPTLSSASTCNGGTACSSSNFQVGRWGIAVGNAVYGPAAATNLVTVANTNANVSSNTYTINLGANLDLSTPIDRYSTTLNFAATAEVRTYAITYTYDSGITDIALKDSDNNTVTPTSTASGSKTYDLYYANSYTVVPTYASDSFSDDVYVATGAGLLNNDTYTYTVGAGTGTVAVTSVIPMQNMSSSLCTTMPRKVYDNRDGQIYSVTKLADNNCWLLDNLALDLTDPDVQDAMYDSTADPDAYSVNTHAKNSTLYKLFNGGGTTSDQYPTAKLNNVAWTSSAQNYYSVPMMVKSGTCINTYCVNDPTSGNWSYDSTTQATINGTTSVYQGKIGIYYNYCAASAGSYCYGNGTSYTGTPTSDPDTSTLQDVKEDICPAGWRLPTSGTGSEFANLYIQYSSSYTDFQTALHTPLSGYLVSGKAYYQGDSGYFWSSTWSNTSYMRYLRVSFSSVNASYNYNRYYGFSIRCLLSS